MLGHPTDQACGRLASLLVMEPGESDRPVPDSTAELTLRPHLQVILSASEEGMEVMATSGSGQKNGIAVRTEGCAPRRFRRTGQGPCSSS